MEKLIHNVQRWLVTGYLFLLPLFFLPLTQEFYITHKFFLTAAVALVILFLGVLHFLRTKKITFVKTPFDRGIFLLLIAYAASIIISSPNKVQAIAALPAGLGMVAVLVILYFILTNLYKKDHQLPILKTLAWGSLVVSMIVIIFWFLPLKNTNLPQNLAFLKNFRFSPVGNYLETLYLTGFLAIFAITQIVHMIQEKSKAMSLGTLGLLGVVSATACILIGYTLLRPSIAQDRLQLAPVNVSWFAALETLKNPRTALVGVGVDNYELAFSAVKPASYNLTPLWSLNFNLSRSYLLHVWVETGLIGLIAVVLIFLYAVREVNGLFAHKDNKRYVFAALGGYIALLFVLFPPSFITLFLAILYLAALAYASLQYDDEKEYLQRMNVGEVAPLYMGMALLSIGLILGAGYLLGRVYASELYFKKSIDALQTRNQQQAYENLFKSIQQNPFSEKYRVQSSRINLLFAQSIAQKEKLSDADRTTVARLIQEAIAQSKVVVDLNPHRTTAWANLALVYKNILNIAQGADSWTIAAYQRALLLDPNNPILLLNLGGVYYQLKNYSEAIRYFQRTAEVKSDWPNAYYNLAWASFQNKQYDNAVAAMKVVLQMIGKNTEDYKRAQKELGDFEKQSKEATSSAQPAQGQLNVATPPAANVSPPIELPKTSGPDKQLETKPAETIPTPTSAPTPTAALTPTPTSK
ncbi:hypothetical protein A3I56_01055 [Candidatus Roizmanbacteria bacterium RIFCSPLOWO2_02_FULL_43_10]|uniref:Uncharacterized protein n=2 Tax=Candidatus Roizmaniibacteriota TaxID=1752723 RepID=A0A1F7JW33_9BACT|nr:MAG: hypothetical protein A3D08_01595 [Candidatus Roizmanbacteria bacterium RIFCSPHIGHO2_02_FULL_43_11]OGK59820.1 MAG: hypothetical protein A3I56_01055 [Candidatus Roizmanbacteria bacterium RIFCSPLOWO2_02_FULL_43_10]